MVGFLYWVFGGGLLLDYLLLCYLFLSFVYFFVFLGELVFEGVELIFELVVFLN